MLNSAETEIYPVVVIIVGILTFMRRINYYFWGFEPEFSCNFDNFNMS